MYKSPSIASILAAAAAAVVVVVVVVVVVAALAVVPGVVPPPSALLPPPPPSLPLRVFAQGRRSVQRGENTSPNTLMKLSRNTPPQSTLGSPSYCTRHTRSLSSMAWRARRAKPVGRL